MALTDLLEALKQDAAARRSEVLARADEEAAHIRSESALSVERRRLAFMAAVRRDEEASARRAISRARGESVRDVLAARSRFLSKVRDGVAFRVARADEDEDCLAGMVEALVGALARLPDGAVFVAARETLVPALELRLRDHENVVVRADASAGTGALARSEAGVEIDGTLEAGLAHAWPRLAVSVLQEADRGRTS
jgi:vacuolar-type H+-ATPase subunit E/Vma4